MGIVAFLLCLFLVAPSADALAAQPAAPIVIGGLFAQTGTAAAIGKPAKHVAELAVEQINHMGGVLGRPMRLVVCDTASTPAVAVRQARRLIEEEHVSALIGPVSLESGQAVRKFAEEKHVPLLLPMAESAGDPAAWTFVAAQRTDAVVAKILEYLRGKNIKKIGILYTKNAFGQDGLGAFRADAGTYGVSVAGAEAFEPAGGNVAPQAGKVQAAGPQAAVVWAMGPDGALAAKTLASLNGGRPLLVQSHVQAGPEYLKQAGGMAGGTVLPATRLLVPETLADEDPQKLVIEAFLKAYEQNVDRKKYPVTIVSGYVYDAVLVLRAAMQQAKSADPSAVRDALEHLQGVVGVSGVYNFSSQEHNGLRADSLIMLIVDSGRYKLAP